MTERKSAAFLDRDGVLNVDRGYVHGPEQFEWIAGAKDAVKRLNDLGYLVVVVSNQSGVARRYYGIKDVERLHDWMNSELAMLGAHIDAFFFSPFHPDGSDHRYARNSECRKPAPGMLMRVMREWPIDRPSSFLVGDKLRDMEAARRAGIQGYLFDGGNLDRLMRTIAGEKA